MLHIECQKRAHKKRLEIRNLLQFEKIDVIFSNETDTTFIQTESDYRISGYKTVIQKLSDTNNKVRIIYVTERSDNCH